MRRRDRKLDRIAALCAADGRVAGCDLDVLGRLVELTEFPAGAVAAPAGVPGRWCTTVVAGTVATTSPTALHGPGARIDHGPETALVAMTAVELLTVAAAHAPRVRSLAPCLLPLAAQCGPSDKESMR